jgi:hydroxymethylbilane synthase
MMLRAATRTSPLARWQTDHVGALLQAAGVQVAQVIVDTLGDRTQSIGTPLHNLGGQGVFVKEVQAAVLRGDADIAVHSAKDLPSTTAEGLVLAGIPVRGDVRDALIGSTLADLREGARVGTSSVRRQAQLLSLRPDLNVVSIRGNVGTRITRVGELDAIVLAAAPLDRLGLIDELLSRFPVERLPVEVMLPMVAQGAIAVECREDDHATRALLEAITDWETSMEVTAERAYLAELGGGCDLPVGALASCSQHHNLITMDVLIASIDGTSIVHGESFNTTGDPIGLGRLLAHDVLERGGRALLDARV